MKNAIVRPLLGLAFASALAFAGRTALAAEGPVIDLASPPAGSTAWSAACSPTHPLSLCVRASPGTADGATLAILAAAERAWDTMTGALAIAPPDATDAPGGAWTLYAVDGVDGGATAFLESRDPVAHLDRGSSFALVDRALPAGCSLDRAVARAVARGALWTLAPATDEGSARAETETLARLATPCAGGDDDPRAFQDQPERAIVDRVSPPFERGASLFFDWLDARFGASPGAFVAGLWALAPTVTPPGAWRWSASPTSFDVLRVSLAGAVGTDSTLDDILVRFAAHRAVAVPPPKLAWHVPWPDHARRFASPVPVAPTGSSVVRIDVAGAPPGASLRVEATWEDFGRMRWEILKLDGQGRVIADVPVTSLPRGTTASMTVQKLDGVDHILVVGANVGSTEHAFDPDQGWWEPHGWLLTIEGE